MDQTYGNVSSHGGPVFQGNTHAGRDIHYNLQPHGHGPTDQEILDWISPLNFWARHQDIQSQRHEGTGTWFLEDPKFQDWLNGKKRVLWCPGIPGSGKTVISSIIVDFLLERRDGDRSVGVTCIYCDYNDRQNQTAINLISSLLQQLLQQTSTLPENMKSIYTEHRKKGIRLGQAGCVNVLKSAIPTFSEVFVVIDALDECTKTAAQDFIEPVLKLAGVRTLVTSRRNSPNLGHHFNSVSELEVSASIDDVRMYLKGRIKEDSELADVVAEYPDLHERIVTMIEKKCRGMFLLCRLHIASLVGLDNRKAVCRALDSLPAELFAAYDETMRRIENQASHNRTRAKQVLLWVSCSKLPMTVRELQHAFAVEPGTRQLELDALPAKPLLISICAGLVTIEKESEIVRLVHETTQSYLEDRRSRFFPNAQEHIAKVCLTYLSFDAFSTGICFNDELLEVRLQENALLGYAAQYWPVHVKGTPELNVKDLALDFLRDVQKLSCATEVMIARSWQYSATTEAMLPENWKDFSYSKKDVMGVSNLHICSIFGLKDILNELLKSSGAVDPKDSNDLTPLHYAVKNGHEAVIQLLLDKGAAVDSENASGETVLLLGTRNGSETIVKFLLDYGAKPDIKDSGGWTPLTWSARSGDRAMVKLLIDKGAGLDVEDGLGRTPLLHAARDGHEAVVKLLLDKGAGLEGKSASRTPLVHAVNGGHYAVVKLLLDYGARPDFADASGQPPLCWAARRGCDAQVKLLLDKGPDPDINLHRGSGRTPLVYAADGGYVAIVKLLLDHGAKPDRKDSRGWTPLLWAADAGHEAVVKLLLDRGADPNIKDDYGVLTRWRKKDAILKLLRDKGAKLDIKDVYVTDSAVRGYEETAEGDCDSCEALLFTV